MEEDYDVNIFDVEYCDNDGTLPKFIIEEIEDN